MSSTSDSRSPSSKFICFHRVTEIEMTNEIWGWFAVNVKDDASDFDFDSDSDHLTELPLFTALDSGVPTTVSVGSKIYCILGGSRRVMCLDMSLPEIGWTEIYSPMLLCRNNPFTAVVDGKIYLMGGLYFDRYGVDEPWAEVFDPCNEKWDTLDPPPPQSDVIKEWYVDGDFIKINQELDTINFSPSYDFAFAFLLDDDGAGDSRNVIILTSYFLPNIYVYDLKDKSWLVPPPPKLRTSFFYDKFQKLRPLCNPVVADKTVYWYTRNQFLCAYNVETGDCSMGEFSQTVECLPGDKDFSVTLHHLSGKRFCLIWYYTVLFFNLSEKPVMHQNHCYPVNIIEGEPVRSLYAGTSYFIPTDVVVVDGKLEASKVRPVVRVMPPVLNEIDSRVEHLVFNLKKKNEEELEGSEMKFVPIHKFIATDRVNLAELKQVKMELEGSEMESEPIHQFIAAEREQSKNEEEEELEGSEMESEPIHQFIAAEQEQDEKDKKIRELSAELHRANQQLAECREQLEMVLSSRSGV